MPLIGTKLLNYTNAQCRTHPSYFHILQYVQVSRQLNHYFLSYRVHRQTDRHTDNDEYSIVAVDTPQL